MSEFEGIVELVEVRESGDSKFIVLKFKTADTKFTDFETDRYENINEGDKVKIIYKESKSGNRTYYNIQDISVLSKGKPQQKEPKEGIHLTIETIRSNALEIATKFEQVSLDNAVSLADKIVKWIQTGEWIDLSKMPEQGNQKN